MSVRVVLEVAPKRSFASALDWPGWARGARTEDEALAALVAYGPRYAAVAERAGVAIGAPTEVGDLEVVELLAGDGSTEFGIPGAAASADADSLPTRDLERLIALLRAAWATFDAVAREAEGVPLRLGPRGGGRQVPKIIEHVRDADASYLAQLGSKPPAGAGASVVGEAITSLHGAFIEVLSARATGRPLENPNKVRKLWAPRYAIRRSAWHALDHAWEIEDRSG